MNNEINDLCIMYSERKHREIDFGPYSNNVLDYIGCEVLVTPAGERVLLSRSGLDFVIAVGSLKWTTPDNIEASYILNSIQTGVIK